MRKRRAAARSNINPLDALAREIERLRGAVERAGQTEAADLLARAIAKLRGG